MHYNTKNLKFKTVVEEQHPDIIWRQWPWCFVGITENTFTKHWTVLDYAQALAKAVESDYGETRDYDMYSWGFASWCKEV